MLNIILTGIEKIQLAYGEDRFKSGDCASLVIALGSWLAKHNIQDFGAGVIERFMHEDSEASTSQANDDRGLPECFSHCYLFYQGQEIDIEGVNAWANWEDHLSIPDQRNKWGEYDLLKDFELEGDNGVCELNSLRVVASQSCVQINNPLIDELLAFMDAHYENLQNTGGSQPS